MPVALDLTDNDVILEILDTFHDFCTKERKKKGAGKKIADDDDEEIDENKLDQIRAYIVTMLQKKYTPFKDIVLPGQAATAEVKKTAYKNALNTIIGILTNTKVNNLSDFENNIVSYFENDPEKSKVIQVDDDKAEMESITFDDIVNSGKGSDFWLNFKNNRNTNRMLEITKGTKSIDAYEPSEKKIIGEFILYYFFGRDQGNMRCTFDAKAGVVSKVFENLEQIKNVIFPQTIADSATTTFNTMKGRNEFIFPNLKTYPMSSTLYSKGEYNLYFENKEFDSHKPYGFSIFIKSGANSVELPFSPSQTEGPSVNYLIDILTEAKKVSGNDFRNIQKKNQILSLGKYLETNTTLKNKLIAGVKGENDGLLFDIKRAGDHEAVAVTEDMRKKRYPFFIFVTIDLLCALESRKKLNPTIHHYGERMRLYRFPLVNYKVSPEEKLKDTIYRLKNAVSSLEILKNIKETINTEINKIIANIDLGLTGFVDVFKGKDADIPYAKSCEQILIVLLNLRLNDLRDYVESIKTTVNAPAGLSLTATTSAETIDNIALLNTIVAQPLSDWEFSDENENYNITVKRPNPQGGEKIKIDVVALLKEINTIFETKIQAINIALNINPTIKVSQADIKKTYKLYTPLVNPLDKKTGASPSAASNPENIIQIIDEVSNEAIGYDALPFFSLYRSLMLLSQATERARANNTFGSRGYTLTMRAELSKLQTAAQEIIDQFPTETKTVLGERKVFKDLNKKIDDKTDISIFRTIPATAAVAATATTAAIPAKPKVNGFVDDFINNLDALPEVYRKPDIVAGGGKFKQRGGVGDAQQYFDLSDVLKEITSQAAAFMESCYSTFYPSKALSVSIDETVSLIKALPRNRHSNQFEALSSLENTCVKLGDWTCSLTNSYKVKKSVHDQIKSIVKNLEEKLDEIRKSLEGDIERWREGKMISLIDIQRSFNLFKEAEGLLEGYKTVVLTTPCGFNTPPTIEEFYEKIATHTNDEGVKEYLRASIELVEDLQRIWESSLFLIQNNEEYTYEEDTTTSTRALSTTDTLTYMLSLKRVGAAINVDSLLYPDISAIAGTDRATLINEIKTNMTYTIQQVGLNKNVSIPILMVLTMLDNIQTPTKKSFFIQAGFNTPNKKYAVYNTKLLWQTNLWQDITGIINNIHSSFEKTLPITPTLAGGSRPKKRYPRKTRKAKKTKRSKRTTRRKH